MMSKYVLVSEKQIEDTLAELMMISVGIEDGLEPGITLAQLHDLRGKVLSLDLQPAPTGPWLPIGQIGDIGQEDDALFLWSTGDTYHGRVSTVMATCNLDSGTEGHLTHFCEINPAPPEEPAKAPSSPSDTGSASTGLAGDSKADNSCNSCAKLPTCQTRPVGYCADHEPIT
jgi:hypothetical protein